MRLSNCLSLKRLSPCNWAFIVSGVIESTDAGSNGQRRETRKSNVEEGRVVHLQKGSESDKIDQVWIWIFGWIIIRNGQSSRFAHCLPPKLYSPKRLAQHLAFPSGGPLPAFSNCGPVSGFPKCGPLQGFPNSTLYNSRRS